MDALNRPYRSLNHQQIRLLSLAPGFYDDTLQMNFKVSSFDQNPIYTALSYVWGTKLAKATSRVEGVEMTTTSNLSCALRQLRQQDKAVTLWVDALCINQQDNVERAAQVLQMKKIYESAKDIYAWLGLPFDDNEARLAVQMMRRFNRYLYEGLRSNNDDINTVLSSVTADHADFPKDTDSEVWRAWDGLAEMFNSPYWHRVWIYQEATTPGTIQFASGEHTFNDILLAAAVTFGTLFSRLPGFASRFEDACGPGGSAGHVSSARNARQTGHDQELLKLIAKMRKAGCSNPRDRVYAALEHAVDVKPRTVDVNYEKSIAEIYTEVAQHLLTSHVELTLLGHVFRPYSQSRSRYLSMKFEPEVPTWVPDWRYQIFIPSISNLTSPTTQQTHMPLNGPISLSVVGSELHVLGCVINNLQVANLTEVWDTNSSSFETPVKWYYEILRDFLDMGDIEKSLKAALLAGQKIELPDHQQIDDVWALFNNEAGFTRKAESVTVRKLEDLIFKACFGRRLAVLSNMTMGIVPAATEPGDKIAAFCGGRCLYTLREIAGHSGVFEFVGECYVGAYLDVNIQTKGNRMLESLVLR